MIYILPNTTKTSFKSLWILLIDTVISILIISFFIKHSFDQHYSLLTPLNEIPDTIEVLYIPGGAPSVTASHIKSASIVFRNYTIKTLLFINDSRKNEYDPALFRNLTMNEWVIKKIKLYNIAAEKLDTVSIPDRFFGTLSEACYVTEYLQQHNHKHVLIHASPGHINRIVLSFNYYLKPKDIILFTSESTDSFTPFEHVSESIKLKTYQFLLFFHLI
jgi:hypothetical protein